MATLIKVKDFFVTNKKEHAKTLFLTICLIYIINSLNIYRDFSFFEDGVKDLLLCLIGGYIGLLGFSISGIAIIIGLFNKEHLKWINKNDNRLNKIMECYSQLSVISISIIIFLLVLYMALYSTIKLVDLHIFWVIELSVIYSIVFSFMYTAGLVKLTIRLYSVKNTYDKIIDYNDSFKNDLNEIKIDMLFTIIMEQHGIELEQLISRLLEVIESSDYDNKENLKRYVHSQYNINKSENS